MATLESGFNPTYSKNAAVLTGNLNRVTVEVEDTIDKDFWNDLLGELCPEKEFHFDPYHTVTKDDGSSELKGKGKSQIINASTKFNAWHIGCVDSDYDWILSDYTDDGKTINSNKYLLQTYAYSIENLMCLSNTLDEFCYAATEEVSEFDFVDYLCRLSKAVYPLLVWSAYLYSKKNPVFPPTAWHEILINNEKGAEASLSQIETKAKAKIDEFDKTFAAEIATKNNMKQSLLEEKDVTEENAYLYVRGHDLFNHLHFSVIKPSISVLRSQHYETLRTANKDESAQKVAIHEHHSKEKSARELLSQNYLYKNNTPLYDKIKTDVSLIWE